MAYRHERRKQFVCAFSIAEARGISNAFSASECCYCGCGGRNAEQCAGKGLAFCVCSHHLIFIMGWEPAVAVAIWMERIPVENAKDIIARMRICALV